MVSARWWHSRSATKNLTTRYETDPTASYSMRFIGMYWSREFYHSIGKKPGVVVPTLRKCCNGARFFKPLRSV